MPFRIYFSINVSNYVNIFSVRFTVEHKNDPSDECHFMLLLSCMQTKHNYLGWVSHTIKKMFKQARDVSSQPLGCGIEYDRTHSL